MGERLMAKLDRLGAEAGIKQMTPEIYKFFQLINDDKNKQFGEATYWYYDKDGKLYSSNEVKLRISSTDNSLHFGAVPQHVKDLHGLLPLSIKREWVDLTDEEKDGKRVLENGLLFNAAEVQAWELGVDYAESKLKEKNT
jgi:hypothetical protein